MSRFANFYSIIILLVIIYKLQYLRIKYKLWIWSIINAKYDRSLVLKYMYRWSALGWQTVEVTCLNPAWIMWEPSIYNDFRISDQVSPDSTLQTIFPSNNYRRHTYVHHHWSFTLLFYSIFARNWSARHFLRVWQFASR